KLTTSPDYPVFELVTGDNAQTENEADPQPQPGDLVRLDNGEYRFFGASGENHQEISLEQTNESNPEEGTIRFIFNNADCNMGTWNRVLIRKLDIHTPNNDHFTLVKPVELSKSQSLRINLTREEAQPRDGGIQPSRPSIEMRDDGLAIEFTVPQKDFDAFDDALITFEGTAYRIIEVTLESGRTETVTFPCVSFKAE
ncbi:MAG: hypothetical protein D6741_13005, partial [Planctomycetota bacterium]